MNLPNVLVIGTGEYVTGLVNGAESSSDKGAGVIGLTLFDLRQRGLIGEITLCGTNGQKFPAVREHFQRVIADRYSLDTSFHSFPADNQCDHLAWKTALAQMSPGDAVLIFTPDNLHFEMAYTAAALGLHLLIAKPIVKTVSEHDALIQIAEEKKVHIAMEVHKRWDPIYADARSRLRELGDFSYFQSYMSQPKSQLESFRAWAGESSDINYYLNAHHIDFHLWTMEGIARAISVVASSSAGVALKKGIETEDSITLMVDWEHLISGNSATAIYTSAWSAPAAEVHSQQRFTCLSQLGEVRVDQAHRGYEIATDSDGYSTPNPLFMRYQPDTKGNFVGQDAYGYVSISTFLEAIRGGSPDLATVQSTRSVTAILEAGRLSLDQNGARIIL